MAGGTLGGGALGALALPLLGFGAGGVVGGSIAASWQSSIGLVSAGSFFAVLQSLGATGLGVFLFGGLGSAMGLLGTLAARLNWCNDRDCDYNTQKFMWEKCPKCDKPVVSEINLLKLRSVAAAGYLRSSLVGADMLPIVRYHSEAHEFNVSGQPEWWLNIDSHAANRLFIAMQSLQDFGLSVLLFGDIHSALSLLKRVAAELDWCKDYCSGNNELMPANEITSSSEIILINRLVPDATVVPFVDIVQANLPIPKNVKKSTEQQNSKLREIFSWKLCPKCNRPLICEMNLWKIRTLVVGGVVTSGALGVAVLPLIGFGAEGIIAGSIAASWQSSIGSVAAGSIFSTLQSWRSIKFGAFLFGTMRTALTSLPKLVDGLNWCNNDCGHLDKAHSNQPNQNVFKKVTSKFTNLFISKK